MTENALVKRFADGFSRAGERLIGLEYEMLGVDLESGGAVPFSGGSRSVETVLTRLRDRCGWSVTSADGPLLELERDGSRITLEPGAQIELSARPHRSLAAVRRELCQFKEEVRSVSGDLGIGWLAAGLQPLSVPEDVPLIPKQRYDIMTRYLPTRGAEALWMMRASAGMQINLDLFSPEEAARKLRLALLACPLITAIFANSPLSAGRENGFRTRRGSVWNHVDPDRCGVPAQCIDAGASVADYVEWALDAGMFFVMRGDDLIDMTGVTFRDFLASGARGQTATIPDWELHLTTLFPEARLKTYLEVRCADSNSSALALAYVALALGLFYGDDATLAQLETLVEPFKRGGLRAAHDAATRSGLQGALPDGTRIADLARRLVAIAATSLDRDRPEDRPFLEPAERIVATERTPADAMLETWRTTGTVPALVEALTQADVSSPHRG